MFIAVADCVWHVSSAIDTIRSEWRRVAFSGLTQVSFHLKKKRASEHLFAGYTDCHVGSTWSLF